MKISKLFHCLYAVVMLLPVFAIGVTCGYAMFNKNAYQSYAGENINKKDLIVLTNVNQFEVNKKYCFDSNSFNIKDITLPQGAYSRTIIFDNVANLTSNLTLDNNFNSMGLYIDVQGKLSCIINEVVYQLSNNRIYFEFSYISNNFNYDFTYNDLFYSVEYNNNSFVSEVFYYSVDKVTQSNMFSWAYNSFLVAPFTYIVALFSMPTNSPVVMLLSYWLSISIIWLVFDLVMYVPLLVHRWLDKGAIE